MKSVLGIGNALVDIMTRLDHDARLEELGLPKGSMQLVDIEKINKVLDNTRQLEKKLASGGSAANTIHGLAGLGVNTSFIGKVGRDEFGQFFREDMERSKINPLLLESETASGRAVALVSTDSERTFATYLGAAVELTASDVKAEHFRDHHLFHIEGYLVQNHDLIRTSLVRAKENGLLVSLDMASYNVVEANHEFLRAMVSAYVDILFANEDEARALTGLEPAAALEEMASMCHIAVVKVGHRGSLIRQGEESFHVSAYPASVVDTTGAGDLYAAGFLFALLKGLSLDECGEHGSLLAARVIELVGAKIDAKGWKDIHRGIQSF